MTGLGERFSSALSFYNAARGSGPGGSGFSGGSSEYRARYKRALTLGGFPGGLSNDGNTCFMNSVLQSFASSNELVDFLKKYSTEGSDTPFSEALLSIMDQLNTGHGTRSPTYRTKKLMKSMKDGPSRNLFLGYNQEDAQEFYQNLMKQVEKEYLHHTDPRYAQRKKEEKEEKVQDKFVDYVPGMRMGLDDLGELGDVFVPAKQVDPSYPGVDSKVYPLKLVTPVDGLESDRIGCTRCGETGGIRYSVVSGLGLTLPPLSKSQYYLEELIDDWNRPEQIEGVECNRCGLVGMKDALEKQVARYEEQNTEAGNKLMALTKRRIDEIERELQKPIINDEDYERLCTENMTRKTTKIKQAYYSRPPAVLCVHVNRSVFDPKSYTVRKNNARLVFPIKLDMSKYVATTDDINMDARLPFRKQDDASNGTAPALPDPRLQYSLKSVISHFGTHNYGHYIAYRKYRQTWWRISDEIVRLSSEEEVLNSQGTFMLFYELSSRNDARDGDTEIVLGETEDSDDSDDEEDEDEEEEDENADVNDDSDSDKPQNDDELIDGAGVSSSSEDESIAEARKAEERAEAVSQILTAQANL